MASSGRPSPHRVWVGNLAPGLPRHVLMDTVHWLGLAPIDFALFHADGGVNSAGVLAFATEQEADYAVSVLHGLLSPSLCGPSARAPVKARRARGEGGGRAVAPAPSAGGGGFSGGVIRLRGAAPAASATSVAPLRPRPPQYPPPLEVAKRRRSPPTPPWRKKAKTAQTTKPEHEAE